MKEIVACGIMFNEKKQILMGKRSTNGTFPGIWEFPGGKVEYGETVTECLSREWKEELNLSITIESLLTSTNDKNTICYFFIWKINDLENIEINVHDTIDFFYSSNIKNLSLFEGDELIVDLLE